MQRKDNDKGKWQINEKMGTNTMKSVVSCSL